MDIVYGRIRPSQQAQPGPRWQRLFREMQELPQGLPFRQTLQHDLLGGV